MALYIMVRHRLDKRANRYENRWHDDLHLASITTEPALAQLLEHAMKSGELVFVHRCSGVTRHARIACSVHVTGVEVGVKPHPRVSFDVVEVLDVAPRPGMRQWKIHYPEEPPPLSAPTSPAAVSTPRKQTMATKRPTARRTRRWWG